MDAHEPNSIAEIGEETNGIDLSSASGNNQEEVSKETKLTTRAEVIEKLKTLVNGEVESHKDEIESLKALFYKLKRSEIEENKKSTENIEGEPETTESTPDLHEEELKELLVSFKEKKAAIHKEMQEEKENNLKLKYQIIEDLKALTDNVDDVTKRYPEFQQLQQKWKGITNLPQANLQELWKSYQVQVEKFYDLLKINKELREYDFKKNHEQKIALSEAAEKLANEPDVISAFYTLQKFHEEWREIGPVAKELRDEVWNRFKNASSIINKRHQTHFESLRENEQKNEDEKIALCTEIEAIQYDTLTSHNAWEEMTKKVLEFQAKWKTLGFASKKINNQLFERFRKSCDEFFSSKYAYFKTVKDEFTLNLEKKRELCAAVEALKESTEWKETTDKLVELQKQWKAIGPVPRKYSDSLWKQFVGACDHFFEQKKINASSFKSEEKKNLALKREVIAKLKALDPTTSHSETLQKVRESIKEFNAIGHVPFKEKDTVYKEFHDLVDQHYQRLNHTEKDSRINNFKKNLSKYDQSDNKEDGVMRERRSLLKQFDTIKSDLLTYENNMGFLSFSSKGSNKLQKEMEKKMQQLKDELEVVSKKISLIDESLEGK